MHRKMPTIHRAHPIRHATLQTNPNRIRRSIKRAGRVTLIDKPVLPSAKGIVLDVKNGAGSIRPSDKLSSSTNATTSEVDDDSEAPSRITLPFFVSECITEVRAGDEVSYLLAQTSEKNRDSARAVAVAQSLGLRFVGGPRINRQQCVNKFRYREAKRPEKNSLGFPEGWRERLREEMRREREECQEESHSTNTAAAAATSAAADDDDDTEKSGI